jgi:hypothetical protein
MRFEVASAVTVKLVSSEMVSYITFLQLPALIIGEADSPET